jgi:hypothetical protein
VGVSKDTLDQVSWASHNPVITDETELTKIVVVGQRSYEIPRDVFEYMDGIRDAALEEVRLALTERLNSYSSGGATYNSIYDVIELVQSLKKKG